MFCKSPCQNTKQCKFTQNTKQCKFTHSPCQNANQCTLTLNSQHFTYFLVLRKSINLEK